MSNFLTDLLNPASGLTDLANTILGAILPESKTQIAADERARLAAQIQIMILQSNLIKGQLDANTAEAGSTSIFVSGWRPFIGWICGTAFAFNFVILPVLTWFYIVIMGHATPPMPQFDMTTLMGLLTGMLGMGTLRSFDKAQTTKASRNQSQD